jgi:restriction endonuclease S subunit
METVIIKIYLFRTDERPFLTPFVKQQRISSTVSTPFATTFPPLPAEIAARQKQYEYYRDKLLTFKELT